METAYPLDKGDRVSCYECSMQRVAPDINDYGEGEAFLLGPGHYPYDGNANYFCREHLDGDVLVWTGEEEVKLREY